MDRVGLLVGGKHGRLSKLRLRFLFAVYLAVLSVFSLTYHFWRRAVLELCLLAFLASYSNEMNSAYFQNTLSWHYRPVLNSDMVQ
jgi:hypothetical protein